MLSVYGIKNCDSVKKTLALLNEAQAHYEFYDFKKLPPTMEHLARWEKQLGVSILNKKGMTYRKKKDLFDQALEQGGELLNRLLIENPSAIKRPIVEFNNEIISIGYDSKTLDTFLSNIC